MYHTCIHTAVWLRFVSRSFGTTHPASGMETGHGLADVVVHLAVPKDKFPNVTVALSPPTTPVAKCLLR